ncbi:MAG: lysylphosphatidylglycerol synthase domain-containing protein [Acidimicrobiales bacterium]
MTDDPTAGADDGVEGRADDGDVDALADVSAELHRKTPARRAAEGVVSVLALVVMFALVLPKVTGSTYHDVAHELDRLTVAEIAALAAVWAIGIVAYAGVLTAVLPGLRRVQGVVLNTATSAVSNVVPFGGAVGVGATYGINRSWGFGAPAITLAILVSGVWNVFLKLGLPVIALVLLVVAGEASSGLVIAAALGFVALAVSVVVLTLVMRSEQLASAIGRTAQRTASWGLRTARRPDRPGIEQAVLEFRHHSSGLISNRWPRITAWMLCYSLLQFALQLLCLRFLGESSLSSVEVFAGFAFGRLLSTIPLTPSGVGFADTGAVAALVRFGGDPAICTAGVLLFTGFIFLLEIPVGGVSWVVWARMRSWRRPPGSMPQPDFATPPP